jgi:UDP-N-acetylmuramate dehydrogenase
MLAGKALPQKVYFELKSIPELSTRLEEPLHNHTRFLLGGPASVFAETTSETAFTKALQAVKASDITHVVLGGGTNLIVSDQGFQGVVLRYIADDIRHEGNRVHVDAGAELNNLVDSANQAGLKGLETLAGIPGWVGAAVYGNAGAYGHSISECVDSVRFFDGSNIRQLSNADCEFRYRESIFKRRKDWIIFSVDLVLSSDSALELQEISAGIRKVRNEKFPPTMMCAGSIFKNILLRDLPQATAAEVPSTVVREGKIPSAWFLEQVGAKGTVRGGIRVADYHANLIYNTGSGTAAELCELIADLKTRVFKRFALQLEEEVQYVGFTS